MSLHVIVLLYPHGAQERGCTACVRSVLLSGWSGCQRCCQAAVRPLCAVGLSGSCQAVTLGPDSDGTPLMSGSAVRLSDTCCQAVRESAVSAVGLSGAVRRCPGVAVRLSDQGSGVSASEPSGDSAASDERLQRHGDHQEEEAMGVRHKFMGVRRFKLVASSNGG